MGRPRVRISMLIAILLPVVAVAIFFFNSLSTDAADVDAMAAGEFLSRLAAFKRTELGGGVGLDAARKLANRGDDAARVMGVLLASKSGEKKSALSFLAKTAEAGDLRDRRAAVFALGELGEIKAIPVLKTLMVDPDDVSRTLARMALVKLGEFDRPFPSRADCPYTPEVKKLFEREVESFTLGNVNTPSFKKRLVEFLDNHSGLDVSAIKPEKISVVRDERGSSYDDKTGRVKISFFNEMTPGILFSHLIHETAVTNLGFRERFGATSRPSYVHDLAVLTEIAYARVTCVSRLYLWEQSRTIESLWTRFAAEKWIAKFSILRNGLKVEPFEIEDRTLFEGVLNDKDNFVLRVELDGSLRTSRFEIEKIAE